MSYQVLARRWRPQAFGQMVGQEHVLRALVNALESNRLHHAYLLTGTRGVGKTTLARLIAKCLNCERGVGPAPCGECSACREIADGRFVDLLEVDAASRTKVEDTRELLDNVLYAPARGRYKVYLIDEVHMLSGHSFNALLKTLEEPPPHVKFLLATTDPQRLPATVLSRCLQLHLRNLTPAQIAGHLARVLAEEGVACEEPALWDIALAAQGSMRDALSLTDQAIAHGAGAVSATTVAEMLGYVGRAQLNALLDALLAADAGAVLAAVAELVAQGSDCERALGELLVQLHRIALAQAAPAALGAEHGDREGLERRAAAASPEDVQLYYQIGLQCRRDLPYAPDARSGLEMALLRMLAFRPAAAPDGPPRSLRPREAAADAKKPEPAGAAPAGIPPTVPAPAGIPPAVPAPALRAVEARRAAPAAGVEAAPGSLQPAAVGAPQAPAGLREELPEELPEAPRSLERTDARNWPALLAGLDIAGAARGVAAHTVPVRAEPGLLELLLDQRHAGLQLGSTTERLSAALGAYFGCAVEVLLRTGAVEAETPAAREQRLAAERQRAAEARIDADANVRLLVETFGGRVHRETIRPLEGPGARPAQEGGRK